MPKPHAALDSLRRKFSGEIILPGAPTYDDARKIFNAMIDRRPAVIAQCATVEDVVSAIRFGREAGLEIAVRGGGHGVAGRAVVDEGLVIDLRPLNAVSVDAKARTATVGGGATMSQFDRATQPHGLATTGGRVSTTGVGGFTLGGGSGWLERMHGLACDNLVSVDLVTADGRRVRASDDENPELFWALHGGGGNFGVATSLTFRLHPVSSVTAMLLFWSPEAGPKIARAYRDFMTSAPNEISGGVIYLTGPPEPFVPPSLVGKMAFVMLVAYVGGEKDARRAAAPMLRLGHAGEMIAEMPYAELQCMIDDPPDHRNYWSAEHLESLPDEAIDAFCGQAVPMIVPSPSQHILLALGGALKDNTDGYPIPWRAAPWVVHPFGLWENAKDDGRGIGWARGVQKAVKPWTNGTVYLNFIGDEGEDRVVAGFGRENYARLAAVKKEFDPDNVFRRNHNIKPA